MTGYRQLLAVPGMTPLLGVALIARAAVTADIIALTMHVVLTLELSYAAAGTVAAALTAGVALGGPLLGRMIDRRGARVVLLATAAAQLGFWASVPMLPFGILLPAAFAAGFLMVPVQPVARQAIAAMTAAGQRQAAFALESVMGELSYIIGPAVVIVAAAHTSPDVTSWGVGAVIAAGGVGLALLDPPLRSAAETTDPAVNRPRRRDWLGAGMIATLVMAFGTTALLAGIDLAIVATLTEAGQVSWAALVVGVLGTASVVGGLVYGASARSMPTWLLLGLLGLLTVPVGLAGDWPWLCVAVIGAGLLTAPTLSTVADAVSRLAPAGARGEATGLQASALSAGFALGSPIVGLAIDASAPAGGFAAAGLAGLVTAAIGWLVSGRSGSPVGRAPRHGPEPTPEPAAGNSGGRRPSSTASPPG